VADVVSLIHLTTGKEISVRRSIDALSRDIPGDLAPRVAPFWRSRTRRVAFT